MNPSIDDRLASIIRSLTDIVMPGLSADASLALEQLHLSIGHLRIIRVQIDAVSAFEAGELEDADRLGRSLMAIADGGPHTKSATEALAVSLSRSRAGEHVRQTRERVNAATEKLVHSITADGSTKCRARLPGVLIPLQADRTLTDRRWFALMGFDSEHSGKD